MKNSFLVLALILIMGCSVKENSNVTKIYLIDNSKHTSIFIDDYLRLKMDNIIGIKEVIFTIEEFNRGEKADSTSIHGSIEEDGHNIILEAAKLGNEIGLAIIDSSGSISSRRGWSDQELDENVIGFTRTINDTTLIIKPGDTLILKFEGYRSYDDEISSLPFNDEIYNNLDEIDRLIIYKAEFM